MGLHAGPIAGKWTSPDSDNDIGPVYATQPSDNGMDRGIAVDRYRAGILRSGIHH